ncbi:MAG TPA: hypothetical protein VKE96_24780 [Vicinamibacterales bacterium]|nr:hypothetical protein [Vicinamibacterales bacterium]
MAGEISTHDEGISVGAARKLFTTNVPGGRCQYDVSRDGQRFLVNTLVSQQSLDSIDLILKPGWSAPIQRAAPDDSCTSW